MKVIQFILIFLFSVTFVLSPAMNLTQDSAHENEISCCSDMDDQHHGKKEEPCKDCKDDCTGNCNDNGCHVNVLNLQASFTQKEELSNQIILVSEKQTILTNNNLIIKELIFSIWHPPQSISS